MFMVGQQSYGRNIYHRAFDYRKYRKTFYYPKLTWLHCYSSIINIVNIKSIWQYLHEYSHYYVVRTCGRLWLHLETCLLKFIVKQYWFTRTHELTPNPDGFGHYQCKKYLELIEIFQFKLATCTYAQIKFQLCLILYLVIYLWRVLS